MTSSSKRVPLPVSSDSVFSPPQHWVPSDELYDIDRSEKNVVANLTLNITSIYKKCNPDFKSIEVLPQRLLSNPGEPASNNGNDNVEGNLICRVHDKLKSGDKSFTILDLLGTGTFGQVFRCKRDDTKELVAVKVIKNKPAYHTQGMLEIKIAKLLNANYDPSNDKHIVRLVESFEYLGHICLVFELLSMSLLDLLTQNQFRGLPLSIVQRFTKQILTALVVLEDANVIHCDLKPENILIVPQQTRPRVSARERAKAKADAANNGDAVDAAKTSATSSPTKAEQQQQQQQPAKKSSSLSDVKVIDFGSACFEGRTIYSYIQSRFYRSPEVLLGAPYTGAIDMWSLACVCAEMYLGLPLFPGISQHNQLSRIVEVLGVPPDFLIETKHGLKYFTPIQKDGASEAETSASSEQQEMQKSSSSFLTSSSITSHNSTKYRIKTAEEYAVETNTEVPTLKKYLRYSELEDIIMKCSLPNKAKLTPEQKNAEMIRRQSFLDFLRGLFKLNPFERWTAKQAIEHPFIKNIPLTAPFVPPQDLKVQERKLLYMVQLQQRYGHLESDGAANAGKLPVPTKGLKAMPSNFGSSGAQPNFTPLQYSNRRLSEPVDSHTAGLKSKLTAAAATASNNAPADNGGFDNADRPMLKRGAPVHAKAAATEPSSTTTTAAVAATDSSQAAAIVASEESTKPSALEEGDATKVPASPHANAQPSSSTNANKATSQPPQQKQRRSFTERSTGNATNSNNYNYTTNGNNPNGTSSNNPNEAYAVNNSAQPGPWMGGHSSAGGMVPPPAAFMHGTPPTFSPMMPPPPPYPMAGPGNAPPGWQGPGGYPPQMLPPGVIPPGVAAYYGPNGTAVDANGHPLMFPPAAVPVPTMEPYYGGSLVGSLGGSQLVGSFANSQLAGSLGNATMASSFAPSSYGVFAVGSDGNATAGSLRMKEFATTLHRAEADEQRRFLSQQQLMFGPNGMPMAGNGPPYWPPPPAQATYTPYNMHNVMMDPNAAAAAAAAAANAAGTVGGANSNNPHYQGSIANYLLNNPVGGNGMQMAQSYDSRMHQRMMLARQPMAMPTVGVNMGMMPPPPSYAMQQPQQSQQPGHPQQSTMSQTASQPIPGGQYAPPSSSSSSNANPGAAVPPSMAGPTSTTMAPQMATPGAAQTGANGPPGALLAADQQDVKSIDSSDNYSAGGNVVAMRSMSRQRTGSLGTGGNNTPSNNKPPTSDADWDPFFEADD